MFIGAITGRSSCAELSGPKKSPKSLGRDAASLTDEDIERALSEQIERVNAGLEHYERIGKFALIREDFPPEVRSINAFQKVKVTDRAAAARRYVEFIEQYLFGKNRS